MSSLQLSFADQSEGMLRKVPRTLRKVPRTPFGESVGSMAEVWINRKQTRAEVKLSPKESLPKAHTARHPFGKGLLRRILRIGSRSTGLLIGKRPLINCPRGCPWQKFCTNQASRGGRPLQRSPSGQKILWLRSRCCSYSIYIIYQTLNCPRGCSKGVPGTFGASPRIIQINEELDRKGLFVKKGTIIAQRTPYGDASVIESSNRPLSKKKRSDLEQTPSSQIDSDAI